MQSSGEFKAGTSGVSEAASSLHPACNTRLYVYMRGTHDGDSTWPRTVL
jgi:hypothetical protein